MIKDCLSAAGIKRIIWIDDHFAPRSREALVDEIIRAGLEAKKSGMEKLPGLEEVALEGSAGAVHTRIEGALESKDAEEIRRLSQQIWDANSENLDESTNQDDLSAADFLKLRKALGTGLQTLCFTEWSKQSDQFRKCGDDTLFLVDKEFTRESPTFDGAELVQEVAKKTKAFCILLTHRCSSQDEELATRKDIAERRKVPFYKFSVLSKRPGAKGESIDKRFARAFSTIITQRFTGDIAFRMAKTITNTATEAARKLSMISVHTLDRAIFVNSAREGVPEFDVLCRIFRVMEITELSRSLSDSSIQRRLRSMRAFGKKTRGLQLHTMDPADGEQVRLWRKQELFEEGVGLNALHAPLVSGDVFAVSGERYVLIGQACDLMMRSGGKRRASIGFLIGIRESIILVESESPIQKVESRFFDLGHVLDKDALWQVDFQKRLMVDLDVLDLAVFNKDGCVRLSRNQPQLNITLPEGWERRLKAMKAKFFPANGKANCVRATIGKDSTRVTGRAKNGVIRYPITRVGRLEGATATAILAAWATFETRAALQHDFAADDSEEPCLPTQAVDVGESSIN